MAALRNVATAQWEFAELREKGYADAYKGDRRPVTLVGVNFRLSKRNIDEPLFEQFESRDDLHRKNQDKREGTRC